MIVDEQVTANEPIDPPIDVSQVREEPFSLPDQFHWSNVDLDDDKQVRYVGVVASCVHL